MQKVPKNDFEKELKNSSKIATVNNPTVSYTAGQKSKLSNNFILVTQFLGYLSATPCHVL